MNMPARQPLKPSTRFHCHASSLLAFMLLALLLMMGFRLALLLGFGDWRELGAHRAELAQFGFLGLRFDLKVAALLALLLYWLPMVLTSWWLGPARFQRLLRWSLALALVLLVLLGCIDLGYQVFFGNPIDALIFGLVEDDTRAIASTLLTDRRLMLIDLLFVALAALTTWGFLRYSRRHAPRPLRLGRFVATQAVLLVALLLAARGSLDTFPLRSANASVGDSRFINSLILNSAHNLQTALDTRSQAGIDWNSQAVLRAAKTDQPADLFRLAGYDSPDALLAVTSDKKGRLPHVVFVQMEGWSTEIILGHGENNQVLGEFARHMREDHFFRNFFSNAYGTNPTIEALLLNSPITPLCQSPAQRTRFAMSNALPFKKAGYRTAFISGGDSSWRNHEKFWTLQGFDSYTGRASIEKQFQVDASDNPWGVYEEYVFATLQERIRQAEADGVPLFAYILTTNNHSPIRLPKNYQAPPLDPSVYGFKPDDVVKKTDLTGFHYQTDQFGKFISWVKSGDMRQRVVVAATGDHVLKGFTDYAPAERAYLRYAVPAYFYVPPALDQLRQVPRHVAGSHEDIFPTLFELALPRQSYYRFGTALMHKEPERAYGWIETRDFIFAQGVANVDSGQIAPWADQNGVLLSAQAQPAQEWQDALMAREKNRKLLKQWLLLQDHEQQAHRP